MKKQIVKKSLGFIVSSVITLSTVSSIPFNVTAGYAGVTFEAESPYNINEGVLASSSSCSGGKYVGMIGSGNILQYNNIYVEADGVYQVDVCYISADNRSGYVSVNGETGTKVDFIGTGNWSTIRVKTISVNLKAGYNTIKFYNDSAYMPDFDKIAVYGAVSKPASSYEAEAPGNIIQGMVYTSNTCSGGKYVGMLGQGKSLQINNINAPTTGMYNIAVYYMCADNRYGVFSVNGESGSTITFMSTGNSQEFGVKYIKVYLKEGNNSIKFYNNYAKLPDIDRVCVVGGGYLIDNGNFEEQNVNQPVSWQTGDDYAGHTVFNWDNNGINGSKCLSISSAAATDAYWLQTVRLEPGKNYILKGYIKGSNIVPILNDSKDKMENKIGANFSVVGDFCYSGNGYGTQGTFDWKEFSVDFQVPESGSVTLACRLGNSWNLASGTVWFDNLTIIPDDSLTIKEGAYIYLNLEKNDLNSISSTNLTKWINRLDIAYEYYKGLTGLTPFGGKKTCILSTHYYPGGWAVSGNPIKWDQSNVASELKTINDKDDWSFGILHEIGHNFDDGRWNFDGEFWANTKMYFFVEQYNARVRQNYVGADLAKYYYEDCDNSYTKTIAVQTKYHNDALTYCFIRIKNKIGIEPFRKTFRYLANSSEEFSSNLERFDRFLELLQQNYRPGGTEVKDTFPKNDNNPNLKSELQYIRENIK